MSDFLIDVVSATEYNVVVSPPATPTVIEMTLQGPPGPQGPIGLTGSTGPQGPQGDPGPAGTVVDTDSITEGSTNLFFTAARVLQTVLTGFSLKWGQISALDTVKSSIEKLSGNSSFVQAEISSDVTVPSGYIWTRPSGTYLSGTSKITLEAGSKLKIID